MRKTIQFILAILVAQGAGIIGSLATFSAIPTWYAGLVKPAFAPPNWIFGPVWIILYTLIGISLFFVWQENGKRKKVVLGIFFVHLFLNILWSFLFFGFRNPFLAFLEILLLLGTLLVVMWQFWRIKPLASYLLVPYLLWTSFAAFLNFALWRLNP